LRSFEDFERLDARRDFQSSLRTAEWTAHFDVGSSQGKKALKNLGWTQAIASSEEENVEEATVMGD
jgi:hypothetical protein